VRSLAVDEMPETAVDADDLPRVDIEARRKRTRINALALLLIFVLSLVAPYPWNSYAPLLILVPAVYGLLTRFRKDRSSQTAPQDAGSHLNGSSLEPYARKPKDPDDPRKYRPIG
jgi:hypothetical protein